MSNAIDISVTLKGGLFTKDIPRIVQKQIQHEIFDAVETRVKRGGKGLGSQRNTVTGAQQAFSTLEMDSTLIYPRTRGTSWQRKNVGIVKAMAPRVGNAAARRIAEELGG